jgi:hypothetical protein
MPRRIRRAVLCGLLALAAAAGGCQRQPTWNLAPVEGTVTKGGRPLANVQVTFWPDSEAGTQGPRSSAKTDEAGHYRLRSDNGDDGAAIGTHRVCLLDISVLPSRLTRARGRLRTEEDKELSEKMKEFLKEKEPASVSPRVPPRYTRPDKTPLRAEVRPGPQTLDFNVP